jgi:HEAT repeat protein
MEAATAKEPDKDEPTGEPVRYAEVLSAKLPFAAALMMLSQRTADEVLQRALTCRDRYRRHQAVELISEAAGPRAERLLIRALRDEWAYVRRAAVVGLAHHGSEAAIPMLNRIAEKDPVGWVRSQAAYAIRQIEARGPSSP